MQDTTSQGFCDTRCFSSCCALRCGTNVRGCTKYKPNYGIIAAQDGIFGITLGVFDSDYSLERETLNLELGEPHSHDTPHELYSKCYLVHTRWSPYSNPGCL